MAGFRVRGQRVHYVNDGPQKDGCTSMCKCAHSPLVYSWVVTIKHTMTVTVGGLCKLDANMQS